MIILDQLRPVFGYYVRRGCVQLRGEMLTLESGYVVDGNGSVSDEQHPQRPDPTQPPHLP